MEFFGNMGKTFGLHDLPLKIIGNLYLEPKEISMENIAKKTGYSLASISNTMKMLETTGMVKRKKKPGDRKLYYFMTKDLATLNINKLQATQNIMIKPAKLFFPPLIKEYSSKVKDESSKNKLKVIKNYYEQIKEFEALMKKWTKDLEQMSKHNQKRFNK